MGDIDSPRIPGGQRGNQGQDEHPGDDNRTEHRQAIAAKPPPEDISEN
jgi:hypothetical protein